jgi:hypothetical protein
MSKKPDENAHVIERQHTMGATDPEREELRPLFGQRLLPSILDKAFKDKRFDKIWSFDRR